MSMVSDITGCRRQRPLLTLPILGEYTEFQQSALVGNGLNIKRVEHTICLKSEKRERR